MCVCVCVFLCTLRTIKPKRLKLKLPNLRHRDSPSLYRAHQRILDQKVKGQGHRVTKCITSRRDSAAPSRCGCLVVLLKAIEWPTSVMHSIECPATIVLVYFRPMLPEINWIDRNNTRLYAVTTSARALKSGQTAKSLYAPWSILRDGEAQAVRLKP